MYAIKDKSYRAISSPDDLSDGESLSDVIPQYIIDFYKEVRCRTQRDGMLRSCDWTQVSDCPLTDEQKSQWELYRQALRDVPSQSGFPDAIDWPEPPVLPVGTAITKGVP